MPQALPFGTDRVSDSITGFRGLKRSFDWEFWIVLRMREWNRRFTVRLSSVRVGEFSTRTDYNGVMPALPPSPIAVHVPEARATESVFPSHASSEALALILSRLHRFEFELKFLPSNNIA